MFQKSSVLIVLLVLCCCVLPASAVIQEVTLKGVVKTLIPGQGILSIEKPSRYGCDYPAQGAPVCSFSSLSTNTITGTVPDEMAFTVFKEADSVVATSIGGTGGTWIALGKLAGPGADEEYVTNIVGDPAAIPVRLAGDYVIKYTTSPDCAACSGTLCTATSATVTVLSGDIIVAEKKISPRQTFSVNARNDGSSVSVTFVEGKAPNTACPGSTSGSNAGGMATGPQPVSDFIISIVPPLGYTPGSDGTVATAAPAAPEMTPAPAAPAPTTHAPLSAAAALGALCLLALAAAARRR